MKLNRLILSSYLMDTRVWNIVLLSLQKQKKQICFFNERIKITTSIITVPSDTFSDELHNRYVIKIPQLQQVSVSINKNIAVVSKTSALLCTENPKSLPWCKTDGET